MDKKIALISLLFSFSVYSYTHNIEMQGMKFKPDKITVKKGDDIVFTNKESMQHNVVSPQNKIRSPFLKKGDTFKIKAEKLGKIDYYCEPHKAMNMKGVINVEK